MRHHTDCILGPRDAAFKTVDDERRREDGAAGMANASDYSDEFAFNDKDGVSESQEVSPDDAEGLEDPNDLAIAALLESTLSTAPVAGYTHNFYRYPARFSPQFARKAIETFSEPGDTVVDPFMGGATSAVEALLLGRKFVGCDINPLSVFLGKVKTTPLSSRDREAILIWGMGLADRVNLHTETSRHEKWERYQRNVPWWIRKTLEMALDSLEDFRSSKQRRFARCTLLRAAQWALDCREELPSTEAFLTKHRETVHLMLEETHSFGKKLRESFQMPPCWVWRHRRLMCRSAEGIDEDGRIPKDWIPPRLVLTSPPYVGVHILYHRWQVQGRRETPAAYWLANCQDGQGEAHYTFAGRRQKTLDKYLATLGACFRSITKLLDERSLVVQLVAFSKPDEQLGPYLETLQEVGLQEVRTSSAERLWRTVPNRKWYAKFRGTLSSNKEVLLVHRRSN